MFLSYSALQRYGKQLLSLDSKLHREFLQHLLCIAVDDESYGLLCGNASLFPIEELFPGDLTVRGIMLEDGTVFWQILIRKV